MTKRSGINEYDPECLPDRPGSSNVTPNRIIAKICVHYAFGFGAPSLFCTSSIDGNPDPFFVTLYPHCSNDRIQFGAIHFIGNDRFSEIDQSIFCWHLGWHEIYGQGWRGPREGLLSWSIHLKSIISRHRLHLALGGEVEL